MHERESSPTTKLSTRVTRVALRAAAAVAMLVIPAGLGRAAVATDLAAGFEHACILNAAGGLECWGENESGQLGDGTTEFRGTPTGVTGLAGGVAAVTAGAAHTCAATTGGAVRCWGRGSSLGNGTTTDSPVPVDVTGLASGVVSIGAGSSHTCAVTAAGGVQCWGGNRFGPLGDGTTIDRTEPVDVAGLTSGVASVSSGSDHTCAVTAAGGVKCWGYNSYGQLGDGTTTSSATPVDVVGLTSGVASVAAGEDMTCAITTGGGLKCWGRNSDGNLGDGTVSHRATPVNVVGLSSGVASVAVPERHLVKTCAVTTAGALLCWGRIGFENEPATVRFHGSGVSRVVAGERRWTITTGGVVQVDSGSLRSGYGPLFDVDPPVNPWLEGCVYGYGDSDGDALCDSYDACTSVVLAQSTPPSPLSGPQPRLVLTKVNADPVAGNDGMTFRGKFNLPPGRVFGEVHPFSTGARIALVSPAGTILSLALPPGGYLGRGTVGWQLFLGPRQRWQFTDSTGAPGTKTVTRVRLIDRGAGLPGGEVEVVVSATAGTFPISEENLPLQALILLDDTAPGADALCGQAVFNCACLFNGPGTTLTCVNGANRGSGCPRRAE